MVQLLLCLMGTLGALHSSTLEFPASIPLLSVCPMFENNYDAEDIVAYFLL